MCLLRGGGDYDDVHVSFLFCALGGLYCRLLILPKSIATDGRREVACIDFLTGLLVGLNRLLVLSRYGSGMCDSSLRLL